jgi:hypothetical protein
MRRMNPLFLLLALLFVLVPVSAQAADLQIAGGKPERVKREKRDKRVMHETPPRKGIYTGVNVRPGAAGIVSTFVPVVRGEYEIGGGITDRFTLGVALGGTAYLGLDMGSFNADVVAYRFFGKGFFLRGALGVGSHLPAMGSVHMRPGVGGSVGLGYEFRVLERLGVGLGGDYDLRMRMDGRAAQTWLLGLRFTVYLNKKKSY